MIAALKMIEPNVSVVDIIFNICSNANQKFGSKYFVHWSLAGRYGITTCAINKIFGLAFLSSQIAFLKPISIGNKPILYFPVLSLDVEILCFYFHKCKTYNKCSLKLF